MNLKISDNPNASKDNKRLIAVFQLDTGKTKTVKFGMHKSAGTFYDTGNEKKKAAYIARHSKLNEDWNNIMSAGALSYWILWQFKSIKDIKRLLKTKFNIRKVEINFRKY